MTTSATALEPLVDALVGEPLDVLSVTELQAAMVTVAPLVGRLEGWMRAAAVQLQTLTGGELPTDDGGKRSVAGWVAQVRHDTAAGAGRDLRTASASRRVLPAVVDAVLDGVLTPAQAEALARLIGHIDDASLSEAQHQLVAVATERDPAELGAWVRHQVATHCEPALERETGTARARRYLQTRREPDGSLRGSFLLAGEDSEVLLTVLEPLARRDALSDDRTAGQRRADALIEVCEQVVRHGELPDAGGLRPQLSYVLPADWAAGRDAEARCTDCGPRCEQHQPVSFADTVAASLPGVTGVPAEQTCATAAWTGPQTRARIETVLCDARITRVLLSPAGQVVGLDSLSGEVTRAQRRALIPRDHGCVARGCTRPPAFCDAHHLRHREDGGETCLDNLVLLCRRHHLLWHQGRLQLRDLHVPWLTATAQSGAGPPDEAAA